MQIFWAHGKREPDGTPRSGEAERDGIQRVALTDVPASVGSDVRRKKRASDVLIAGSLRSARRCSLPNILSLPFIFVAAMLLVAGTARAQGLRESNRGTV
jgi:hypothetical protein